VFNGWTEKSLGRLAELMPGRYAKAELSSGFLGSMESYAYRLPAAQLPVPPAAEGVSSPAPAPSPGEPAATVPVQTTQTQPTDTRNEVVAHADATQR
jgi:hypothetical protein